MEEKKDAPLLKKDKPKEPKARVAAEKTKPSGGGEANRRQLEMLRRKLREKFHTS